MEIYSQSSPVFACTVETRWTCRLEGDWTIELHQLAGRVAAPYHFRLEKAGRFCREWLHLDPTGRLTIRADYASDGCSMVPDFPSALPGCILHDAMRQALQLDPAGCPWTRREADVIFRETLQAFGFNCFGSWLYYFGVAGPFGWLYSWIKNWGWPPKDRLCTRAEVP